MAVKNLLMFGSFDSNVSSWYEQAQVFPQALAQVFADTYGSIDGIRGRLVGTVRVKGGTDSVVKGKVEWDSTGDNERDALNGSKMALLSVAPDFLSRVGEKLKSITGASASALIAVASSQENAILNSPPGLTVSDDPPDPGEEQLTFTTTDGFNYQIKNSVELAIDAVGAATITLIPSGTASRIDKGIYGVDPHYVNWTIQDTVSFPIAAGGVKDVVMSTTFDGTDSRVASTFDGTELNQDFTPVTIGDFTVRGATERDDPKQLRTLYSPAYVGNGVAGCDIEEANHVRVSGPVLLGSSLFKKVSKYSYTNKTGSAILAGTTLATIRLYSGVIDDQ